MEQVLGVGTDISAMDWLFAATLWKPLSRRDWLVTIAVLAFVAFNFYLWSLPISQYHLFLISTPLGLAALIAFTYFAPRK